MFPSRFELDDAEQLWTYDPVSPQTYSNLVIKFTLYVCRILSTSFIFGTSRRASPTGQKFYPRLLGMLP